MAWIIFFIQKKVLGLNVSMDERLAMHVVNSFEQLLRQVFCLVFTKSKFTIDLPIFHVREHVAVLGQFSHDIEFPIIVQNVENVD